MGGSGRLACVPTRPTPFPTAPHKLEPSHLSRRRRVSMARGVTCLSPDGGTRLRAKRPGLYARFSFSVRWAMTQVDKVLVVVALVLGLIELLNVKVPFSRFSAAGLAIVLLAVVELHQGGVLDF